MAKKVRLGIIGLTGRWARYRIALQAVAPRLRVTAVYDPCAERADAVASDLNCQVSAGVVELIQRDDVDALFLAGRPWFGLWPLLMAVQNDKPILSAVSPIEDEDGVQSLLPQLSAKARIQFALAPALELALRHLRGPAQEAVGNIRLIQVQYSRNRDRARESILASPLLLALLSSCADLMKIAPQAIHCRGITQAPDFTDMLLEFPRGALATLTLSDRAGATDVRIQIQGETDVAEVVLPRRIQWTEIGSRYQCILPNVPPEVIILHDFATAVAEKQAPTMPLARACAPLAWLRAARQSREEGRRILL